MIDIKELRRRLQAATPGPWIAAGPSFGESLPKYLNEVVIDRAGDEDDGYSICNPPIGLDEELSTDMAFIAAANPSAISELLDRLEAAESDALEQARLNGMGASREAALMAKLEAAEAAWKVSDKSCYDLTEKVIPNLRDQLEAAEKERESWKGLAQQFGNELDTVRAKIKAMEQQAPFDADSDVFRSAFDAALKAGNWPATRQGEGYRAAYTHIAWRIAFSTVNRLKLYTLPGAKGEEK